MPSGVHIAWSHILGLKEHSNALNQCPLLTQNSIFSVADHLCCEQTECAGSARIGNPLATPTKKCPGGRYRRQPSLGTDRTAQETGPGEGNRTDGDQVWERRAAETEEAFERRVSKGLKRHDQSPTVVGPAPVSGSSKARYCSRRLT